MSSIVFFAFSIGAYLLFFQLQPYSTMYDCSLSLVAAFLGKFNFSQLIGYYGNAAGYYLLIYLVVMILFVTNILISLINDYLAAVSNDPSSLPRDHEVIGHFFSAVQSIVIGKTQTKATGMKQLSQLTSFCVHSKWITRFVLSLKCRDSNSSIAIILSILFIKYINIDIFHKVKSVGLFVNSCTVALLLTGKKYSPKNIQGQRVLLDILLHFQFLKDN